MSPTTRQKIQLVLLAAIIITGARTAYILYQRHTEAASARETTAPPLNPDYYVTPKKLHPYDLESARQLTQQPVWVKEGYRYTYYPYDTTRHGSDFDHPAGQLLPIEKLEIKEVVTDRSPGSPEQKQLMAVFAKEGKTYAFPIGSVQSGNYQIYSDEMLFIQDPHELYQHWPADVWSSIDSHQVKAGMNEIQAAFALGMGVPERSGDSSAKTVHYPNGGKPVTITFRDGKAAEITQGKAAT